MTLVCKCIFKVNCVNTKQIAYVHETVNKCLKSTEENFSALAKAIFSILPKEEVLIHKTPK